MRFDRPARLSTTLFASLSVVVLLMGHCAGQEKINPNVKAMASATRPDAEGKQTVTLTLLIDKDWYIYANPVKNEKEDYQKNQTKVVVTTQGKPANAQVQFPAGKLHEEFGQKYMINEGKVTIQVFVQRVAADASPLEVDLTINTCHAKDKKCLPRTHKRFILP